MCICVHLCLTFLWTKNRKREEKKVDMLLTSGELPQKLCRYLNWLHFAASIHS
jgi:hypothetical protein